MKRLERLCRAVLFPPAWLAVLIALPSFALVIYVLASGESRMLLAYGSYFASAYALVITAVRLPGFVRALRMGFVQQPLLHSALHSRQGERYRSDAFFRTEVSLYAGLGISLLYAAMKLIFGVVYRSYWFGVLAGYYLLLALLRYALLHYVYRRGVGHDMPAEWRRCRLCGFVLLAMNQALGAVVYLMAQKNNGFVYPGFLIYAMAAYAFYSITLAIVNMVKFGRRGSPVMSAAQMVNLVAAMVTMLALETAMLTQFGSAGQELFRRIMVSCSGIAVCAAVLVIAVYMIVRSTRELRAMKIKESACNE